MQQQYRPTVLSSQFQTKRRNLQTNSCFMIERKVNSTGIYRKIHRYEIYTKNQNKPKIAHSKPLNTNVALLKFENHPLGGALEL